MDHLPYPVNPTLPPVSVPYICEGVDPYDARGFVDFPVRRGWMAMTYQTGWCECAPDIAAVRAQTWLYFGVLYEFFGSDFLRPMFIRDDIVNSQDVLTTQALPYLLKTWFNKTSQRTENSNAKIRALLLAAERYSEPLDSLVPSARVISLSIKVLICSLGTAAGVIDSGIRKNETFNASPSRLLEERMLELNWCPYWVKVYVEKYSVPTVNYLSAITRTTMPEDHRACKPSKCVAHNVDMQHYETKHVLDGCNCHFVGPDIGKVIASIQEGSVPLIRCKEAPNGNMFLDVIDADPGVEYTAISHVWSGGLGNPTTNALPECQLRMLTKRMQQISGVESEWFWFRLVERGFKYMNVSSRTRLKNFFLSWGAASHQQSQTAFWLDTLCVPAAEEYLTLRRKAICQMAFIYAGADRVLVLDPELQKIAKGNMPNEQVCAYLASCAWRSRCWPYQEGRLAKDRLYLLKDDLYHHSVGLRQIRRANRDFKMGRLMLNDKALVHSALAAFWEDMDDVKSSENEKENLNEFIKSWNSLGLRSTTKLEDLHSILAVLLGLSSKEILSLELKERMKAIFYAQALLPIALLYVPQFGERVYDVKNQWIPQYPSGHLTLRYGSMRLSVDGEALTFSPADSLSCGFLVNPMKSVLPRFCLIDDASSEKIWIQLTGIHNKELEALYGGSSVCYVLYNHIAKFQPFSSGSNSVGARFYVSRQNSESEVHLIYDCPLKYTYKRPLDENVDLLQLYDYPEVQGQRTRADITFFLDCDIASWYKPRYRRPNVTRLDVWRNIYTAPVMIYILIIWCPCVLVWVLGAFGKGVRLYSTALPALIAAFIRVNIGRYFELPLLIETYKRLEHKQWSASLDERRDMTGRRSFHIPDEGPLYQYRPQWIAGIIILAGCSLLIMGFPLDSYNARILGAILILETVPRVLVELLWRRTRLGDFGRMFVQRWLHRIYWEADSHQH